MIFFSPLSFSFSSIKFEKEKREPIELCRIRRRGGGGRVTGPDEMHTVISTTVTIISYCANRRAVRSAPLKWKNRRVVKFILHVQQGGKGRKKKCWRGRHAPAGSSCGIGGFFRRRDQRSEMFIYILRIYIEGNRVR